MTGVYNANDKNANDKNASKSNRGQRILQSQAQSHQQQHLPNYTRHSHRTRHSRLQRRHQGPESLAEPGYSFGMETNDKIANRTVHAIDLAFHYLAIHLVYRFAPLH